MKKSLIVLAGLTIGTAALAQTSVTTTTMPNGDTAVTTTTQMPTQATDVTDAAPSADTTVAAEPRVTLASGLPAPTTADMSTYPHCSRAVTDHCVQHEGRRYR